MMSVRELIESLESVNRPDALIIAHIMIPMPDSASDDEMEVILDAAPDFRREFDIDGISYGEENGIESAVSISLTAWI